MSKEKINLNWEEEFESFFDKQMRDEHGDFYGEVGGEDRSGTEIMEEFKSFIKNLLANERQILYKQIEELESRQYEPSTIVQAIKADLKFNQEQ